MTKEEQTIINAPEKFFQEAIKFHQEGNIEQALDIYQQLNSQYPTNSDVLNLLGVAQTQLGSYDKGVENISRAISINPSAMYYTNLAQAHFSFNRFDEVIEVCKSAIDQGMVTADIYFNYGNGLYGKKDFEAAIDAYEKSNELSPDYITSFNLGNSYRDVKKYEEAIKAFKKSIEMKANYTESYNNLGNLLRFLGRHKEAKNYLEKALVYAPDNYSAYANLALVCIALKQFEEARMMCEKSLQLNPDSSRGYNHLGLACKNLKQLEEAKSAFEKALELDPEYAEAYLNLGELLISFNKYNDAKNYVQKSLELKPDYAEAINCLGSIYLYEGNIKEACKLYEKALSIDPKLSDARVNLIFYGKGYIKESNQIELIKTRLSETQNEKEKARLYFGLGKIYDESGDYDRAFENYLSANNLVRKTIDYSPARYHAIIESIKKVFNEEFFRKTGIHGIKSKKPVFIVGMPRSGTTLVEQIIASHPMAFGAGELNYFNDTIEQIINLTKSPKPYPECMSDLKQEHADVISEKYMQLLSSFSQTATRVTNKMPSDYIHLGLIALLFPETFIINCNRNEIDTCFSIFSIMFAEELSFAYDLTEIGARYFDYRNLMTHWRKTLPIKIYDINYAELINNQEEESRKLIDFLELPWDEKCLSFYNTERPVKTASLYQVRQPMYKTSIEKWKNYEKHLTPLIDALNHGSSNAGV